MSVRKRTKGQTIASHCLENVLLIPQDLHNFQDATPLMFDRHEGIFHKLICQDMHGIEFFTHVPCLAYVINGLETFYRADGQALQVKAGDMLLMPRHNYMVSDFHSEDGPLEAYLFFFDDKSISQFLKATHLDTLPSALNHQPTKFSGTPCLAKFIEGIKPVYQSVEASPEMVTLKLVEFLLLLSAHDKDNQLTKFLISQSAAKNKRNLTQVMREHMNDNLSIADYAELSGRSLSTFQRDFKRQFGASPSAWLRQERLKKAAQIVTAQSKPITQIAIELGYADTSHFIKAFKRQFNMTPKQMQLEHRRSA